ncbi:putative membrane domain protein, partial [Chlamydia psittaci 84-8471/1]
NST